MKNIICYNCQQTGHYESTCTNDKVDPPWKKTAAGDKKVGHSKVTIIDDDA